MMSNVEESLRFAWCEWRPAPQILVASGVTMVQHTRPTLTLGTYTSPMLLASLPVSPVTDLYSSRSIGVPPATPPSHQAS